jgi:hypothetical protein
MTDKIAIYYDHYKDTFELIKSHIAKRDNYFVIAFLFFSGSIFTTFNPSYVQIISNAIGREQFGVDLNLAFYILNSVLVFISFWFLIRYYQATLCVESGYTYIHKVEEKLSALIKDFEITREGKSYFKPYPIIKSFFYCFYNVVFPAIIIIASLIKGYWEFYKRWEVIPPFALAFDLLCLLLIVTLTILYLSWVHFSDFISIRTSIRKCLSKWRQ